MLSNPTNNLHNRQRQHRRQNSTPNAFDSVKVHDLPNIQRHGAHRRGISLDTRRRQTPPQDINTASTTNQGYQSTQQHILRETQQQSLVRPGQQFTQVDNDENYLNSPIATPQRQSFDASCTGQYGEQFFSQYTYNGPINSTTANLFSDGNLTPSAFLDFSAEFETGSGMQNSENNSRRSSRRISGGIVDRVAKFESLALQSPSRPITPPSQDVQSRYFLCLVFNLLTISGYFPPTPVDTPFNPKIKHEQTNQRFLDNYDTSMEETIKPKSSQRSGGNFDDMRKEADMNHMPSPPRSGTMPSSTAFDSAPMPSGGFMNMSNLNIGFMKHEKFDGPHYSPASSNISPALSYLSSPEIAPMTMVGDPFGNKPSLDTPSMYPEPPGNGPPSYRRSESVSSSNLEENITDTGITIDQIATFISGPDPSDGRWLCLYPDCKKRFGRKENIKSHVQTHLGDRQFQCRHCKKCFVRQHDLKRHAKIHSGIKPYPCQCGNSFARHDALTRHRQRGMCIGAFEGIVKKSVKRGRPRKNRPDDEDRLNKSSRTRSKNKAMSSASSTTGSESNSAHSPRSDLDDILDSKPFGEYDYTQASSMIENSYSQTHSPIPSGYVSPQAVQSAPSPSAFSSHSAFRSHRNSIASVSEHLPSHPGSPAKSVHSQYHTPPELCESSSSPAPSNHYYDLDHTSNHGDFKDLSTLGNISEHDDEMFLEAFSAQTCSDGTSQLERDPDLLMGKFEDAFGAAGSGEDLFRNGSENDIFFGSP
jgi:regulatory protein SWI5